MPIRLINVRDDGSLSLVEREESDIPPYAILSHTWGDDGDEVTYQDMIDQTGKNKIGYAKLTFCVQQVAVDDLQYFWIDTCCIDKSRSAELSEAITSMFRWYERSAHCYVYLSDVSMNKRKADDDGCLSTLPSSFKTSRWFTRGWTLQELLAPPRLTFFSREGKEFGDKSMLLQQLHEITQLPIKALQGTPLRQFPIADRLNWNKTRQTKRSEDMAYSLLGIFGISMSAIYGEGGKMAMKRLQREIRELDASGIVSLGEGQRHTLMESLRFDQIDSRHMTIKNAHIRTCKWILSSSEYRRWLDVRLLPEHSGLLWIKGKPGAGKSTLMKFAFANARSTMKDEVVVAYFFNARGEILERSTTGTYRSLLLQLFERVPALQCAFDSLGLSTSSISANYQWSASSLEMLFEAAIQNLGGSSVVCFIDALDECDEKQIREMIGFLERVSELAVSFGVRFKVCLSSRHYPEITIKKGLSLVLEGQEGHSQDITKYLESELKIGSEQVVEQIRERIRDKAAGIFMWVILVVNILNREFDRGRIHALKRRLEEIPEDLHTLFRDILTRDSRNQNELILCIQWVLFAEHPLSPVQLYNAILCGIDPIELSPWDSDLITEDTVRRRILDVSKGLTEITKSNTPKVQFIHESVRDFLL
ncbi:HET-domain-containing protein, partial [Aaosphaeria arxii CBS 175.79]